MYLTVNPLHIEKKEGRFDLFKTLLDTLQNNHTVLNDGDILVISTKFVSNSQGRIIRMTDVKTTTQSNILSKKFQLDAKVAEIILRESDHIFGGIAGFVMASTGGIMAPNAGIDKSNAKRDAMILYPEDPHLVAEQIHRKVFLEFKIHVGVVLVDSRLMPARTGTSGVAVACAGIEPVRDMRAERDLDGNMLKVTSQAVADSIATIANLMMGEGSESRPFAIVSNSGAMLTSRKINRNETAITPERCVYVRSLSEQEQAKDQIGQKMELQTIGIAESESQNPT